MDRNIMIDSHEASSFKILDDLEPESPSHCAARTPWKRLGPNVSAAAAPVFAPWHCCPTGAVENGVVPLQHVTTMVVTFIFVNIYICIYIYYICIYIYICIYSNFWVQKSVWNRCHILTSSNVVKTRTNHPSNHHFHGRYKPFPVRGGLWNCFTHISSNRSVNNQHNPRPPTAAVDRGERGAALARGQGISGSHDDEAKRRSHGPLGWDIMGLGLVIKRCPIGCFFAMIFGWKGDES